MVDVAYKVRSTDCILVESRVGGSRPRAAGSRLSVFAHQITKIGTEEKRAENNNKKERKKKKKK